MLKKIGGVGVAVATFGTTAAHAALPAGVEAGFTAISGDATTLAGYAGTALMVILGLTIGIKLTKRFANRI